MKRSEILTLMQARAERLAELGQVVQVAMEAEAHIPEDLGAMLTVADQVKAMADEFKAATTGAVGKEARVAVDFEQGLRKISAGCRLLADGLGGQSANLLAMGKQWHEAGAKGVSESIQRLA